MEPVSPRAGKIDKLIAGRGIAYTFVGCRKRKSGAIHLAARVRRTSLRASASSLFALAQEPHARLRVNAGGVEKMSDVLLRFAEPILNCSAPIDEKRATLLFAMSSVSTTNISGTDNDFGRPSGTGVFLYRYPGTSYLATIMLSLRDEDEIEDDYGNDCE